MRYSEPFIVYVGVRTRAGFRYLQYTSASGRDLLGTGIYVQYGLGSELHDGAWHRVVRDLEADLKAGQPDNELEAVESFLIRGSGRVDDIKIW